MLLTWYYFLSPKSVVYCCILLIYPEQCSLYSLFLIHVFSFIVCLKASYHQMTRMGLSLGYLADIAVYWQCCVCMCTKTTRITVHRVFVPSIALNGSSVSWL